MLITGILPALADPSNAYNQQHLYVLNSLAQVKSIVLLTDIPSSEALMMHLFTNFFDILSGSTNSSSGEQMGKNVELGMTSILIIVIDESATLPSEVVDVLVAQFLRTDPRAMSGVNGKAKKTAVADEKQSILMLKEPPAAYNMAKTICNSCPEKMARYISQYFNDVIVDASSSSAANASNKKVSHRRVSDDLDDSEAELAGEPSEDDLKELRKVHQLLRELWRACPAVLQNVIPQLETELAAENVHLRSLATETFGDIISGIGAAGLPPPPLLDPAAYPPMSLSDSVDVEVNENVLTKPLSPQPFPQAYQQAYTSFLGRSHDKSPTIRAVWTTGIGRILATSAGGVGLSQKEEERLTTDLARMLGDADEKVRIAAVRVVGIFSLRDVIFKIGPSGGLASQGSVLGTLAERVRDRKHLVRVEAMRILGRLWGVAAGEILAGESDVISAIGAAPTKLLDTFYANEPEINILLDHVVYEQLLPLSYPPIKGKSAKLANGNSQKAKGSQISADAEPESLDPDKIRVERILLLVKGLEEKAKKVFFSWQVRQVQLAKYMAVLLGRCEDYNGGVIEVKEQEQAIKGHLSRLIEFFARQFPDTIKATECLWKFVKMHDRRCYQLIRFCIAPESDYRTVNKAFKELIKRIEQSASTSQEMLNIFIPLLYRVSVLVYNKSHVEAIMEFSRTDEESLGATAHELLREISTNTPEVLRAQVQGICTLLQEQAPNSRKPNVPEAVDNLKACASFASKYAKEIPQDRKFVQAMTNFALYGIPAEAAKHAITIIMTASDKKEMLAKELVSKCIKSFKYGGVGFLAQLATLSQLMLLAPSQANQEIDAISTVAIQDVLLQNRSSGTDVSTNYAWTSSIDAECEAKCWALKILVNRVRSHLEPDTLAEIAEPVYRILSKLVANDGECLASNDTSATHKPHLRLLAARLFLKLCTKKHADALLNPISFNALALVTQDVVLQVRSSFLQRLKKYLGQQKLGQRFYAIPFLLAFEPNTSLKSDSITWIRSRVNYFHTVKAQQPASKASVVMELVFARLLSLLAHHPDYGLTVEELTDFARYITFYLNSVATEENLSLIYHIAQRVKQMRDAISPSPDYDDRLYYLSDLAQMTIRKFEEAHHWSIQTMPAKVRLPTTLFSEIRDHEEAQQIAERNYLPEEVEGGIEGLVRTSMRNARSHGRKRRSEVHENGEDRSSKRARPIPIRKGPQKEKKLKAAKTPKTAKRQSDGSEPTSTERRKSGRVHVSGGIYAERDDEEDDEEMAEGVATWKYEDGAVVNGDGKSNDAADDDDDEDEEKAQSKNSTPKRSPKGKKTATTTGTGKGGRRTAKGR